MPTLILSNRYTDDSQVLWRAATFEGWDVVRLQNWRIPKQPLPDPVVYVESLFAPMIGEQLGLNLREPPEDWLVKLPNHFSKRMISLEMAADVRAVQKFRSVGPLFIKPPNDKSFPAKVYASLPDYVPADTAVLVQEEVEWEKEFRCFCLDGKVLTLSIYCRNHQVQKHEDWYSSVPELQDAKEFAEVVMESVETPRAVVMDVGVIKDKGWAVVELNAAWGSGIYGCQPKEVLHVVRECMEKSGEVMTHEEMIAKFVQVFRCTESMARCYLCYCSWNYEAATDAYWRENILIY